jgi:hypothetical protein
MATAGARVPTLLAICVCAAAARPTVVARAGHAVQVPAANAIAAEPHLITAAGIGGVRLGMTLDAARRALPGAKFFREMDAAGALFVSAKLDDETSLLLDTHDDARFPGPIDWARTIVAIETFSPVFYTREGIHPGSPIGDAIAAWGPVRQILESDTESRQYVTFQRHPARVRLRLSYSGVFTAGSARTTQYTPDATIRAIAVSSSDWPEP